MDGCNIRKAVLGCDCEVGGDENCVGGSSWWTDVNLYEGISSIWDPREFFAGLGLPFAHPTRSDSLTPIPKQAEEFIKFIKAKVRKYPDIYKNGYNLICHSQGNMVCRFAIESWPEHNVKTYISLAGPQMGVMSIPKVGADIKKLLAPFGEFGTLINDWVVTPAGNIVFEPVLTSMHHARRTRLNPAPRLPTYAGGASSSLALSPLPRQTSLAAATSSASALPTTGMTRATTIPKLSSGSTAGRSPR